MQEITTTTHNIRAAYTVGDSHEWHEIDVNGYTFAEIIDDMLAFWNAADNLAEKFAALRTFDQGDDTVVTEIYGAVYGDDDSIVDMPIDAILVQVTAVER